MPGPGGAICQRRVPRVGVKLLSGCNSKQRTDPTLPQSKHTHTNTHTLPSFHPNLPKAWPSPHQQRDNLCRHLFFLARHTRHTTRYFHAIFCHLASRLFLFAFFFSAVPSEKWPFYHCPLPAPPFYFSLLALAFSKITVEVALPFYRGPFYRQTEVFH